MPNNSTRPLDLVNVAETEKVKRAIRTWLNTNTDKPCAKVNFEFLPEDSGVALSIIQGAFVVKRYICGGYMAQVQFKLVFRTTCETADERLRADEVLDTFGDWCERNLATLQLPDSNMKAKRIRRDTTSTILARYEGNVEDHHILLTLQYEVMK